MDFIGSGGDPRYFNRYAYTANDPINMIDPDGRQFDPSSNNMVTSQADLIKGAHEVITKPAIDFFTEDAIDSVTSLAQGDVKGAGISLGMALIKPAKILDKANDVRKSLPKPPTGRGSVPKADRDPKRKFTPNERAAKRDAQGG